MNVLISSSENAIRGLLMNLCEIPPDRISQLEIPTGVPLIFDMNKKCLKLLDDGLKPDPIERYNFGAVGEDFLFGDEDPLIRLNDPKYDWDPGPGESDEDELCPTVVTFADKAVPFGILPKMCDPDSMDGEDDELLVVGY
jgi:hypothetical protein